MRPRDRVAVGPWDVSAAAQLRSDQIVVNAAQSHLGGGHVELDVGGHGCDACGPLGGSPDESGE